MTATTALIFGRDRFVPEQTTQPLAAICIAVRDGQFDDVHCIVALNIEEGWVKDVTAYVARVILDDSDRNPVRYGSPAYTLIERELGIAEARGALDPIEARELAQVN